MLDKLGRKVIKVPKAEFWNSQKEMFEYRPEIYLVLEHSLVSIAAWESKWKKPFLAKDADRTAEQTLDYVKFMTVNDVDDSVYQFLPASTINEIVEYLNDSMSATFFNDKGNNHRRDNRPVTSELIYYWMITLNIPLECQHWHINRLMTLIKVCNEESKQGKTKQVNRSDIAQRRELNRLRQQQLKTGGK